MTTVIDASIESDGSAAVPKGMNESQKSVTYGILQVAVVLAFLGVWELAAITKIVDPFFISSPTAVFAKAVDWIRDGTIYNHAIITLREALIGWVIGSVIGVLVGFVLGRVEPIRRVFVPLLHLINTLPRIALAPLFIFWFGIGELSKIILVVTIIVFIMIFNTYSGVLTVNNDFLLTARLYGKREWEIMREVIFPWIVPWIFVGLKLGLAWSLSGAVVGEFIAARGGIGYLIFNSASNLDNAGVLAGSVILLILAMVFFLIISMAEKALLKWRLPT